MKKLASMAAVSLAACAFAFAGVELDVGYFGSLSNAYNLKVDDNSEGRAAFDDDGDVSSALSGSSVKYTAPAGVKVSAGIFFADPWIMDIGLDVGANIHVVTALDYIAGGNKLPLVGDGLTTIGGGFEARLGGAFRFNLAERHAVYVSPALFFGFDYVAHFKEDLYTTRVISFGLDVDAGYRFWISDSFGVNVGVDLTVPFAGRVKCDEREADGGKEKILHTGTAGGFGFGLYAGVSWNLGK